MHALVTGGRGFLGRYIVEQLRARGDRVRALCRGPAPELEAVGAETASIDIRDRTGTIAACAGVNVVFHVAGLAGIWGPWGEYYLTNTVGTLHVLEGCLRHGVRRMVYTSSPSVTFDGHAQAGVDERAPYARRWLCHYPHSKALAEQAVLAAHGERLMTCALRPHLIWGPRDRHLIPRLLDRARRGELRRVGNGKNLIDTIYVENAAAAHLQAADALGPGSRVGGKAYFISQGAPVNCWAWINEVLHLVGLPPPARSIPFGLAWKVGQLLELSYRAFSWPGEPRMTRFLAAQLSLSHYFDISAAKNDFGYRPMVSTEEGMERLCRSLNEGGEA